MATPSQPATGYVFVSHAAPDKLTRVKPLARALLLQGVALWLDRPGVGDSHFGFDDAFIRRHRIRGLNAGEPWDEGIVRALRECEAVLLCLSREAVAQTRQVLQQESMSGRVHDNLVACIVDDLRFEELPADSGLAAIARTQCERIDPAAVAAGLAWLDEHPGADATVLPLALQAAWEPVRSLCRDLDAARARGRRLAHARGGEPSPTKPAPFMAPPRPLKWVDRPEPTAAALERLLSDDGTPVLLLHGLPGAGKSSLARVIANDPRVRSHFIGGVLWTELGQEPDLLARVQSWVAKLDEKAPLGNDLAALAGKLAELLETRPRCLLVVDDVWDPQHLEPLAVTWPQCRVLVTARREHVVSELNAFAVRVGPLTPDQALEFLRQQMGHRWADSCAPQSPRPAQVAAALGHLAEALRLLAARVSTSEDWDRLHEALGTEIASLEALATGREQMRGESRLEAMVHISLRALRADSVPTYETFLRLGVLHEDTEFGAPVVARLASLANGRAETVPQFLRDDALLLPGAMPGLYRMHDVLRHVARRLLTSPVQPDRADGLPGLGLTLTEAHRDFVQRLRPRDAPLHTLARDDYSHEHLVRHLELAGMIDELHRLLAEDDDGGGNGWYGAREQLCQTGGYLADLARAQALSLQSSDTIDRRAGQACRYALMRASLRSIAGSLPPALVARLVAVNHWTVAQALVTIGSMAWTAQRKALTALAPLLDAGTCQALLRQSRRHDDGLDWRWLHRAAILAPRLEAPTRDALWREAVDELLSGDHLYDTMSADAAAHLVEAGLPRTLASELFEAVLTLGDSDPRDRLLEAVASVIPPADLARVLRDEPGLLRRLAPATAAHGGDHVRHAFRLALAEARHDADAAAWTIEAMAPHLNAVLLSRARIIAARSGDSARLQAQVALVRRLAELGRAGPAGRLMAESLAAFEDRYYQREAWVQLLSARAPSLRPSEHVRLLDGLVKLEDPGDAVCDLLKAVAPHLPKWLLAEAFELLTRNGDNTWRSGDAREALFKALARHEGCSRALEAAASQVKDGDRANVLMAIAPAAGEADLDRYLELAAALPNDSERAKTVDAIAARLPLPLALRALELVRGVRDGRERFDAAVMLAAYLPMPRREALFDRAAAAGDEAKGRQWRERLLPHLGAPFWQTQLERARDEPDEKRRRGAVQSLIDAAPDADAVQHWLIVAGGRDDGSWLDASLRLIELNEIDHAWAQTQHQADAPTCNPHWLGRAIAALAPHLPADELDAAIELTWRALSHENLGAAADAAARLAIRLAALHRHRDAWTLLRAARDSVEALLSPQADGTRRISAPPMGHWPQALEALLGAEGVVVTDVLEAADWIPDLSVRAQAVARLHAWQGQPLSDEMIGELVIRRRMPPVGQALAWAEMLPILAPWLEPSRCEEFVARAFELVRDETKTGDYACSRMGMRLAPWWPREQLEGGIAWCRRAQRGGSRDRALGALLRRTITLRGAGAALGQLEALANEADLGGIVADIAPAFATEHQAALLTLALGHPAKEKRAESIGAVARCLTGAAASARSQALHQLLAAAERWPRPELIQALAAFAPALESHEDEALREVAQAIDDIGRWWP